MPIPGNTRPFDHPENRSLISRMTGQGAFRKKAAPAQFPPPGSGVGPTTTLPANSPARQKFQPQRPATIPTNSPMMGPMVSPDPSAVGASAAMPKTMQDLIPGKDAAYATGKRPISQRLGAADQFQRGRTLARLQEARTGAAAGSQLPAVNQVAGGAVASPAVLKPAASPVARLTQAAAGPGRALGELYGATSANANGGGAARVAAAPGQPELPTKPMGRTMIGGPGIAQSGPVTQFTPPTAKDKFAEALAGFKPGPGAPSMNEDKKGLATLPTDAQAAERVAYGMKMPNMTYSGTGRGSSMVMDKLMPAGSREEALARKNFKGLGGTATLDQAATDPNFNRDGRFFQGAKLGVGDNGKAYFREGDKPIRFAGGAANAEDANARRMNALQRLAQRTGGKVDPETLAFTGNPNLNSQQVASRLAAGGNEPTRLTPQQLETNKASMLARLGARREQAGQMRAENARQEAIARANQPSPMLQRLMQENPELAVRMMEGQQRGQIAQAQLAMQDRLGQAEIGVKKQGIEANTQIAKDQLAAAEAQLGRKLTHDEKLQLAEQKAAADRQAAQNKAAADLQQNDPRNQIEKDRIAATSKQADAQLKQEGELGTQRNNLLKEQIAATERAAQLEQQVKIPQAMAQKILDRTDLTPAQQQKALAQLQQQMQAGGAAAAGGPGLTGQGGGIIDGLTALDGKPTYAGNNLTKTQFDEATELYEKTEDAEQVRDKLRGLGLSDAQINVALNKIIPPSMLGRLAGFVGNVTGVSPGYLGSRTADDPNGWTNFLRGRGVVSRLKK